MSTTIAVAALKRTVPTRGSRVKVLLFSCILPNLLCHWLPTQNDAMDVITTVTCEVWRMAQYSVMLRSIAWCRIQQSITINSIVSYFESHWAYGILLLDCAVHVVCGSNSEPLSHQNNCHSERKYSLVSFTLYPGNCTCGQSPQLTIQQKVILLSGGKKKNHTCLVVFWLILHKQETQWGKVSQAHTLRTDK